MYIPFDELSDDARVWIYQSDRHLEFEEVERVTATVMNFLEGWQAHGHDLKASLQMFYERFLIVALDEESYQATGCSIDKLVHLIQDLEKHLSLQLMNRMQIAYREDDFIMTLPMNEFKKGIAEGEYNENTIVFNNLIERKGDLVKTWEVPVKDSWHKQMLTSV